ncbi:MAG: site-specific integrase [Acidobacteriota bacterium]|nr:site-specific integrase [Acidobacteriota bacterium]
MRDPITGRLASLGTFKSKAEADRAVALAVSAQTRGAWVDPALATITLATYAQRWFEERPTLRPRTVELYEGLLRLHILPSLGRIELGRLSTSLVRRWHANLLAGEKPGASTVAKAYRLLHAILDTAIADGLIATNPCAIKGAGVERAKERPVITVAQVWALAEAIEPRFKLMVLLAGFMGLRKGELFGLTRERVDLMHRTILIVEQRQQLRDGTVLTGPPKTEAGVRTLAIPESLLAEVESHLERFVPTAPESLLFYGEKGGPLRVHVFQGKWDVARSSVDLEHLHFHDLRHVANTLTAASGASTKELMYRMGHASPAAALRYQHATRDRDAAIAAALSDLVADPKAPVLEIRTAPRAADG